MLRTSPGRMQAALNQNSLRETRKLLNFMLFAYLQDNELLFSILLEAYTILSCCQEYLQFSCINQVS